MELFQYKAWQLQQLLADGKTTCVEITNSFIAHLKEQEERIDAFITVTEELALKQAKEADSRRRQGEARSPWDGIPIALKDNICTAGIATTCGSKMLENYIPPYDATVTAKLKKAGLPILGKTNMDEFAMGSSTENSAYKLTKNPLDLAKVPGGSSGGSAAAVTGLQVPWSLGSDTGGSVREPASFCGLVGIKPTYGRVSRYGLVAFASSLDQIGPFARDVRDAAHLLGIIAGYDEKDSTSSKQRSLELSAALTPGVKGIKIGIPDEYFAKGLEPDIKDAVFAAVRLLEKAGATVQEVSLPTTEMAIETYYMIADAEASSNLARYDGVRYGIRAAGEDIITSFKNTRTTGFGKEVKRRIMLGTYVLSAGYYDKYYKRAQQVRTLIRQELAQTFEQVDVLVTPTTTTTAFRFGEKQDPLQMYLTDVYTVTANLGGVPALSMPIGTDHCNMPIGLQMLVNHFAEEKLLRIAYTLEQLLKGGIGDAK